MEWYALLEQLQALSVAALIVFVVVFLGDFLSAMGTEKIVFTRHAPTSVSVDRWAVIDFSLQHQTASAMKR